MAARISIAGPQSDPPRKWDPDLLASIAGIGAIPALGLMPVDHDPFAQGQ